MDLVWDRLDAAVRAVCPLTGWTRYAPGDSAGCVPTPAPGATAEQRAAAAAAVQAFDWPAATLAVAQDARAAEIDARTAELQAAGFEFPAGSGQRFDLTPTTQSIWVSLMVAAGAGLLTYPVSAGVIGDGTYQLADASAVATFCGYALNRGRQIIEGGADLKRQVYAATTPEAVAAVEDTRV